jgi:hypothetical protein
MVFWKFSQPPPTTHPLTKYPTNMNSLWKSMFGQTAKEQAAQAVAKAAQVSQVVKAAQAAQAAQEAKLVDRRKN